MSALLQSAKSNDGYGAIRQHPDAVQETATPLAIGAGRHNASMLSCLFFSFAYPLFVVGNARQLHKDDMWPLEHGNTAAVAFAHFEPHVNAHRGALGRAIASAYGWRLVLFGLAPLFSAACTLFAPAVLHHVIDAFAAPQIDARNLALWLGALFASRLINALVSMQVSYFVEMTVLRLTASIKSLLFRKALRRSAASKSDASAVDISNLYSADISSVHWVAFQVNNLWIMPLQITVASYMLYAVIGVAAFAGLAVVGASMGASYYISKASGAAFGGIMGRQDERMKLVKEVFGAIQTIKLNAWERKFEDRVRSVRGLELQAIRRFLLVSAASTFVLWSSPIFVSTVSFAVYALVLDETLTAAKVFTAIALFNVIRDPLRNLPGMIQKVAQARVSLRRMDAFLALPEFDAANVVREDPQQPSHTVIAVESGAFAWTKDGDAVLTNVALEIEQGDLVVVHGAVGTGKSALCAALLGEMHKQSGSVFVRGRVAYYSQQTWIQNMTIRDNILFGSAVDEQRYANVLDACGLVLDLQHLPGGDAAEIGEKGVNLSGGQKARVALARACYSDADVFILDAPLAAVDAMVQSEIFSKCICTLLEHKTVVLVTHSPGILASEAVNCSVLVENGTLKVERKRVEKMRREFAPRALPRVIRDEVADESEVARRDEGRFIDEEERVDGRVAAGVFYRYLASIGGVRVALFLVLVQILWQAFQISSDLWLSHWTGTNSSGPTPTTETESNMLIYALLGGGSALMVLTRALAVSFSGLRASRTLFDAMTHALLRAPLRFFDANPLGRIVNRYADDMSIVDFNLPMMFGGFLSMFFFTACQLATAVYAVDFLGVLVLPLVYLYVRFANFYLAPNREVSRLWKVSESPVLSHVTQSEQGVSVIRAFGTQCADAMVAENLRRIDANNAMWVVDNLLNQYFQLRVQLIGCGLVIVVVSALVYLHAAISPGLAGLAFSYALSIDGGLSFLVLLWSWVEIAMVSPERVMEYASLAAEGSDKLLVVEPAASWPQHGSVQFQDVVFSYKPGAPAVLKGLSFDIKANEKIGIVGRTGAGKSSLTMALFRINELDSGRILIDGQDISSMPLQSLRSRLSIIPQAPVLFKGTLRAYMDPFEEYSDAQIWSAFENVEMKAQVAALEQQLAHELSENGENFSVGERQMLCMARALLTQTRIVVMDEATASIDHATEKKLQAMITRDFQDATVLTIAHRLATVLDSDRIMVLRDGQVVEFDSPRNLVKDPTGVFYELASEGGYLDRLQ